MEKALVYQRLRNAMEYQKVSYQTLSENIGISRMGLFKSMKKETLTINAMLEICKYLNMDPAELFQSDGNEAILPDNAKPDLQIKNKL